MHLLPRVFRTEGDMVEFDPSKIYESLIKETFMNEDDAKKITELTVRRIISSGIKFLSGPHIREVVCSILSEQHFEQERKLYTRIGMPLMDYEKILEKGVDIKGEEPINPEKIHHWAANRIAEEYAHLRVLNSEESKAHLYGDIYIHKLNHFDLRPISQMWDPRIILKYGLPPVSTWTHCSKSGPAGTLSVAVNHLAKWLGMTQGEFSGTQGFSFIPIFLAPYAKGLTDEEINQAMQSLIFEINQLSAVIGREVSAMKISSVPCVTDLFSAVPAISLHGNIEGVYGDYAEECLKLFEALIYTCKKGDFQGDPFISPLLQIFFSEEWFDSYKEAYAKILENIFVSYTPSFINYCANWQREKIKKEFQGKDFYNKGTLQTISLNLPRYAFISKDEAEFLEILEDTMHLCAGILNKKYDILEKRLKSNHLPICGGFLNGKPLIDIKNETLAISFIGLDEAIKNLTEYYISEHNESLNLSLRIVEKMGKICEELSEQNNKNYVLKGSSSKIPMYRFANLDLKHFPETANPQKNEKGPFYSNCTHFSSDNLDFLQTIKIQGEFHEAIQNDVLKEISINKYHWKRDQLKEKLILICKNSNLGSIRFLE